MIAFEISDESILALIYFLVFSVIVGVFIVQWNLKRMTERVKKIRRARE